ncbi:MAG TPA: sugar ABC transporter permease [Candidatus Angelobacter sp.]|nr:sugar ABC transporter permease [Candidatus Angelobacter sp.]
MEKVITAVGATVLIPVIVLGYIVIGEKLIERLSGRLQAFFRPYFWTFPAIVFAGAIMVVPTILTAVNSFQSRDLSKWVGLANYRYFFTFPDTLISLRNSIYWLIFFTIFAVGIGLLLAILFDRVHYENLAKIAIFLPYPISAVAASIIWKFMFDYKPPGAVQTGTLNAVLGTVGIQPIAWLVNSTTNNPALIFIGIWTQVGFAMVIISASLKGISPELLEAARIDGATELQVIRTIVTPLLWPTITVVGTTMIIYALKQFDIVYVLTSGAYETGTIANQMFLQLTSSGHLGRAAAVGVVLFIAIVPLLIINVRRFQQQEEMR